MTSVENPTMERVAKPRVTLDDMLTVEEAAQWLKLSVENLRAKSKGHRPIIPVMRINGKVIRYSPRMILAKLGEDSGMNRQLISASLNLQK